RSVELDQAPGHRNTSISSDTRADWSEAFAFVPSLQVGYVWHASRFTRAVLAGRWRVGFEHHQQTIGNEGRAVLTRTVGKPQRNRLGLGRGALPTSSQRCRKATTC